MRVLIVYAHPEPRSFNGTMRDLAVEVLAGAGHQVILSDLYASRFPAISSRADFDGAADANYFQLQVEQDRAAAENVFAADIAAEQERVLWADMIIFQFPIWWQSAPAILKGWFDRVLARGFAYAPGKAFDQGGLRGRRAMCAITTGSPESMFGPGGFYQHDISVVLGHILRGTLSFVGLEVLPTFVAWSAARVNDETQSKYLEEYRARLLALDTLAPMTF